MNVLYAEKRNIYKEITVIALPAILESLIVTFTSIIDSKMVSALGVKTISAVSVTIQPRLLILSIFLAMNIVVSSLVAKYYGKNNQDAANEILKIVLKVVVVLSIIFSIIPIIIARPMLLAFANQPDTIDDSVIYFKILISGMIFNTIYLAINAAYAGYGKTKITFIGGIITCIVNIIFNYLLIEGRHGFPALGVRGAAIATVIGHIATMIYCIITLLNKKNYINLHYMLRHKYEERYEIYKEIIMQTKNTFVDKLVQRLSLFIIGAIVARIGSLQMAVYSVCSNVFNIGFSIGTGSQTAAVALVGRSYGAKDFDKIKIYREYILKFTMTLSILLSVGIIFSRHWFITLFSNEEEFVRLGEVSCIIVGIIILIQSMRFVYIGCLIGLGDMKVVMYTSIVSFSIVNIGALIILVIVLKQGLYGVWISSFLSQASQYIMAYIYLKRDVSKLEKGEL